MRQYPDYKKPFKNRLHRKLLSSYIGVSYVIVILLFLPIIFSSAQNVVDIQSKISQKDAEIKKLEAEITAYQGELDTLGRQKNSLSKSIKELDLTRKKLNADISVTQNKIDKTNLKIANLSSDISDKETSIGTNLLSIKLEIRNLNELEDRSIV